MCETRRTVINCYGQDWLNEPRLEPRVFVGRQDAGLLRSRYASPGDSLQSLRRFNGAAGNGHLKVLKIDLTPLRLTFLGFRAFTLFHPGSRWVISAMTRHNAIFVLAIECLTFGPLRLEYLVNVNNIHD